MGGACSAYVGRGEVHTAFQWGNLREGDHLEDAGLDGRIILRWIFRKWVGEGMDWIDLRQVRDIWLALVNVATNLRVPTLLEAIQTYRQ